MGKGTAVNILLSTLYASLGTLCFAVLFPVPQRHYIRCAAVGGVGWLVYLLAMALGASRIPVPEGVDAAAYAQNLRNASMVCAAGAGACLGFLRFNTNPAKVIMGDTG